MYKRGAFIVKPNQLLKKLKGFISKVLNNGLSTVKLNDVRQLQEGLVVDSCCQKLQRCRRVGNMSQTGLDHVFIDDTRLTPKWPEKRKSLS